jgi:hypothetical protein
MFLKKRGNMAEYIITPDKKELPSGTYLLEELHRRGMPVEINVKGTAQKWDAIRFHEPGPPEIECFASHDPEEGHFNVSVPSNASPAERELQLFLVDILLAKLGGQADNMSTRERYSAAQFAAKMKKHHAASSNRGEIFWLAFAWAVVVFGILLYFSIAPSLRSMDLTIVALAFVSALGLTLTKIHS